MRPDVSILLLTSISSFQSYDVIIKTASDDHVDRFLSESNNLQAREAIATFVNYLMRFNVCKPWCLIIFKLISCKLCPT